MCCRTGNRLKSSDLPTVLLLLHAQLARRLWCSGCKPGHRTCTTPQLPGRHPPASGLGSVIHIELVWFGFLPFTHLHQRASFKREMGNSHCLEGGLGRRSRQRSAPTGSPASTHPGFLTLTDWLGPVGRRGCTAQVPPILQLWGLNSWAKEPPRSLGSAFPLSRGGVAKTRQWNKLTSEA